MSAPANGGPLRRSALSIGAVAAIVWLLLLASPWPAAAHAAAAIALLCWGPAAWSSKRDASDEPAASTPGEGRTVALVMSEHVKHEAAALQGEITRVRALLADAVDGFGQSFELLRTEAHEQRDLIRELMAPTQAQPSPDLPPDPARRASDQADRIEQAVAMAIRHLQFEDLVVQSLAPLREIGARLDALGPHITEVLAARDHDSDPTRDLRDSLAAMRARDRAQGQRTVTQTSMAAGEVELF